MKYLHLAIKLRKNTRLKVHFSEPVKVLLLNDYNYKLYKDHITYKYRGGIMEESPGQFVVPDEGLWHIVVERGGYYNPKNINASVEILQGT